MMDTDVNITIRDILTNISNHVQLEQNMYDLKLLLSTLTQPELMHLSQNVIDYSPIFDALNTTNTDQVSSSCEVLKLTMKWLPANRLLEEYQDRLSHGFNHPNNEVKEMLITMFIQILDKDCLGFTSSISENSSSLLEISNCLWSHDTGVGLKAAEFFTKFGKNPAGLNILCSPTVVKYILNQTQDDEVAKIRFYQVLVDISIVSRENLRQMETFGFFKGLINNLKSDDILSYLSLLEVITPLALTPFGYEFLYLNQIISYMVKIMEDTFSDSMTSLIFIGITKFFGQLGQTFIDRLEEDFPEVLKILLKAVDSSDTSLFFAGIETIGIYAYVLEGKRLLDNIDKNYMSHVIERIKEAITTFPIEMRVRILRTLTNIFHFELFWIPSNQSASKTFGAFTEKWFNYLGQPFLDMLVSMAKQPFPDVKIAALGLLKQLAVVHWGLTRIVNYPDLIAYLLDSEGETLEGKLAKDAALWTIYESPTSKTVLSPQDYTKLKGVVEESIRQRPYQMEVALDGEE